LADEDHSEQNIPPGSYTRKTLPVLSLKAQQLRDRLGLSVEVPLKSLEGQACQVQAKEAFRTCNIADAIGIALGAEGYM
jgi:hypothetical protein